VIVYELLDECMDNGWPVMTEPKVLREYIKTEASQLINAALKGDAGVSKASSAAASSVSWRSEGIKYKKNEIFLDIVEKLNLMVASNGTVLRSEILGSLKMKSFLSGMPECKLGLNDKVLLEQQQHQHQPGKVGPSKKQFSLIFILSFSLAGVTKTIELEDIRFHQCVKLTKFDSDRMITFIPPDGEFELMTYRVQVPSNSPSVKYVIGFLSLIFYSGL
jgi:AP-1 complex subunit mu